MRILLLFSFILLFLTAITLLSVVAINSFYYYGTFRPFMKQNYNYLLDWANGINLGFYKQHGGASNAIRGFRLFLYPPKEIAERNDYMELCKEPGFDKMRKFAVVILTLTGLVLTFCAVFTILMKILQ